MQQQHHSMTCSSVLLFWLKKIRMEGTGGKETFEKDYLFVRPCFFPATSVYYATCTMMHINSFCLYWKISLEKAIGPIVVF